MDRLRELIKELCSDDGYVTGRRRFPRTVTLDDARTIAGQLQSNVDVLTERREAEVKARGHSVACARGCNACCVNAVMIFLPEAHRVAAWLDLPENAAVRARFLAAYPEWRSRVGESAERLASLTAAGDIPGHAAEHLAYGKRGAMCAFNHDGACAIYPVRPALCRDGHALDTNANCDPSHGKAAQSLTFIPMRDFLARARSLNLAVHHAIGGEKRRTQPLPLAVYSLLKAPGTDPSGSGDPPSK